MRRWRSANRVITISVPIFVSTIPIEKRKGNYNRESTIEWIREKLKEAGWDPFREAGLAGASII
jgi:hypothetical protein